MSTIQAHEIKLIQTSPLVHGTIIQIGHKDGAHKQSKKILKINKNRDQQVELPNFNYPKISKAKIKKWNQENSCQKWISPLMSNFDYFRLNTKLTKVEFDLTLVTDYDVIS